MSNSIASECYYAVLGLCKQATQPEIRSAYRKLALKWHPDRWTRNDPMLAADAKRRFQQIQEAYSVLSDNDKRLMYDAGLLDLFEEDEEEDNASDEKGFSDFMQEMVTMMESSRHQKRHSVEELQVMLGEMMDGDDSRFNVFSTPQAQVPRKRTRFSTS